MFKEQNRIYLYLAGIILGMVLLLLVAKDIVIPFLLGRPTSLHPGPFDYREPPATIIDVREDYFAVISTNFGDITIDLLEKSAPNNVNSLVFLSNQGYYNGVKFHRLIPDLLLQGGDRNTLNDQPGDDGFGNPGYFIADEVNWDSLGLSESRREKLRSLGYSTAEGLQSFALQRYMVAMANTRPNTNASQFFFVLAPFEDPRLEEMQGQFTVVARVVAGFEVLQRINAIPVDNAQAQVPRPQQDIVINSVRIETR